MSGGAARRHRHRRHEDRRRRDRRRRVASRTSCACATGFGDEAVLATAVAAVEGLARAAGRRARRRSPRSASASPVPWMSHPAGSSTPSTWGCRVSISARDVAARLGRRVRVENDVNAAALGAFSLLGRTSTQSMAYLNLGTGLAAGLVLGGRAVARIARRRGRDRAHPGRPGRPALPVRAARLPRADGVRIGRRAAVADRRAQAGARAVRRGGCRRRPRDRGACAAGRQRRRGGTVARAHRRRRRCRHRRRPLLARRRPARRGARRARALGRRLGVPRLAATARARRAGAERLERRRHRRRAGRRGRARPSAVETGA